MYTIALIIVSVLLASILVILIRIYHFICPEDLRAGDIVIVTNPHCEDMMMNMVTEVINILSPEVVQVRGIRTTVSMSKKWVRRINIKKGSSIKVPEEPTRDTYQSGNQAGFREVPLEWFSYDILTPTETT